MYLLLRLAWCFCGTPNSRSRYVSDSLPTLETLFLLWVALSSLDMKGFCLFFVFCFALSYCIFCVLFGYYLLEACSFLKGNGGEVDLGKKRRLRKRGLGGGEGEQDPGRMCCMSEE